ncbi:MAG: extracellular solute-binding protein [Rhodocyclales bacterium]|nr:extracellular solute-binding protein [Rhodocyclales bacterium]
MRKLIATLILTTAASAASAQEIVLRHALGGAARETLATQVARFNDMQKGRAKVVLQDLAGLADKQKLPHLALLDEDDAREFFDSQPRYKPMSGLMKENGQPFAAGAFLPQIADAVDDLKGQPQALPMALALPVLFYNKDAFAKANLNPAVAPRTWQEIQDAAGALADAGYACPLTTSRFAWVHLENLSSQHGEPAVVRSGRGERVSFNNLVHVKHLARLASWQKSRYFHYFGAGREGDARFKSGECAMLTGESALHGDLRGAPFQFGVAALPYYEDVRGAQPGNLLPDGASLHALPGKKKNEYQVAARFVAFLMQPQVQRDWVRATGFLPMTLAALDELAAAGVSPAVIEAAKQRLGAPKKADARLRFGTSRNRVRAILNEEIELVWKTDRPAKEALDKAMMRANAASK